MVLARRQIEDAKENSTLTPLPEELRGTTNGGWALGDAAFKRRVAKAAKRRAEPLPRGRPRGGKADKRQINLL